MTSLRELNLKNNELLGVLGSIGKLINLQSLDIGENKLSELPAEIGQLTNLQSLSIDGNQLSELPAEIGQLTNLQSLSIDGNQLSRLPAEIGQLTNLQSLDIDGNQLSELPAEIGQLINLQSLDIGGNQLVDLPAEIGQLTNLKKIILDKNPVSDPPPEIINSGIQVILKYLRQRLEQNAETLYEARLLILGEGGVGKTSLSKKILDPCYDLDRQEASTEGMEVIAYYFKHGNDRDFRVNIWDFGGQEIYHATHQFFLAKRALYVLVVDARQDNTDLYYWLSIVELLGGNSPVFIVKNEKQDRQCNVNEKQLRGEFNNLREILATNLKTNRGLENIKSKVAQYISNLPHVGTELPKKWVDVRRALETNPNNYIALS